MITIDVEAKKAEKKLQLLLNGVAHRAPLMKKLAGTMQKAVLENFEQEGRPKWVPVKHRDGQTLNLTGNLKNSIERNTFSTQHQAIVGTNLEYGAIHQFGGQAGRGRKVKIPKRPFLSLTPNDEQDLIADVREYLHTILKK